MRIELNPQTRNRLAQHAKAAGYDDVERYAADHLQAIAEQPTPDDLESLSEDELADSLAMLRESEADIAAGRTEDLRQAVQGIAEELGLKVDR